MTDVIKLVVDSKKEPENVADDTFDVNEDAVRLMEKYLEDVKSGEVSSVGLVIVYTSGPVAVAVPQTQGDFHRLVSGTVMLQNSLMNS